MTSDFVLDVSRLIFSTVCFFNIHVFHFLTRYMIFIYMKIFLFSFFDTLSIMKEKNNLD